MDSPGKATKFWMCVAIIIMLAGISAIILVALVGLGSYVWEVVVEIWTAASSSSADAFFLGIIFGAVPLWIILEKNFARKLAVLTYEKEIYRNEFSQLKLAYVIVLPLQEYRGNEFVAPQRKPVAAFINGKRYAAGDKISENLTLCSITDQGSFAWPSDFEGFDPEERIKVENFTFHGSSLTDEWVLFFTAPWPIPTSKRDKGRTLLFKMVTHDARHENGSNASLAQYPATSSLGKRIVLPRMRRRITGGKMGPNTFGESFSNPPPSPPSSH